MRLMFSIQLNSVNITPSWCYAWLKDLIRWPIMFCASSEFLDFDMLIISVCSFVLICQGKHANSTSEPFSTTTTHGRGVLFCSIPQRQLFCWVIDNTESILIYFRQQHCDIMIRGCVYIIPVNKNNPKT